MKNILLTILILFGFSNLLGIYSGPGTQEINGVFPNKAPLTKGGMVTVDYDDYSIPTVPTDDQKNY